MTDPKFTKPWHGIPRETIDWHPIVGEESCIGCGVCVTTCGRQVYQFDFARKKAVVAEPDQCAVGCTTCANICPTHAIHFPSLDQVVEILSRPEIRGTVRDELQSRREQVEAHELLPHPDRIVRLVVEKVAVVGRRQVVVGLRPKTPVDCMCQFTPGDYLEIWSPENPWIARAYSIDNAPREDGRVEVMLRQVPKGRFGSTGMLVELRVGDEVLVRGPLGQFRIRSRIDAPLLFIARGSGIAPVKSMIEQQMRLVPDRDMALFWDVTDTRDFHDLDTLQGWTRSNPRFRCMLIASRVSEGFTPPEGLHFEAGRLREILDRPCAIDPRGRDAYLAGPRTFNLAVLDALERCGVPRDRVVVETLGD